MGKKRAFRTPPSTSSTAPINVGDDGRNDSSLALRSIGAGQARRFKDLKTKHLLANTGLRMSFAQERGIYSAGTCQVSPHTSTQEALECLDQRFYR